MALPSPGRFEHCVKFVSTSQRATGEVNFSFEIMNVFLIEINVSFCYDACPVSVVHRSRQRLPLTLLFKQTLTNFVQKPGREIFGERDLRELKGGGGRVGGAWH